MEPRTAASQPDPEAVEFIRFCYQRRRVGWPELYDEMCAVAARGLYRGYGSDDLAELGIGFSLFEMPSLAAMAAVVVAEEQARRRPVSVTIRTSVPATADGGAETDAIVMVDVPIAPAVAVIPVRAEGVPVMGDVRPVSPPVRRELTPTPA